MSTPAIINPAALNHLGAVVHHIRPTWDPPGIRSALETALAQHPYPLVAAVAVNSAADPKANTPAVIRPRCENGWMTPTTQEPPTRTPPLFKRCDKCGNIHSFPGEKCYRRADPERVRAIREAAKAIP